MWGHSWVVEIVRRKGYRKPPASVWTYKVRRRQIISDETLTKARGYLPDGYYKLLEKIAKGPPGVYPS
jgi:hypothetical protein